jgi:hypothetical protein
MAKNNFQKPDEELALIKSTLNSDLDESSVDIYAQDLFAPPQPEKKETPVPEPEPKMEEKAEEKAPEAKEPEREIVEKKVEPEKPTPSPQELSSPGELKAEKDVEEMELNIETGELKSLAATKEDEELDETEESLTQLEKMTDDFMSVKEVKKLYKNMNLMIDMLNLFMVRLDAIERRLKKEGIFKDK